MKVVSLGNTPGKCDLCGAVEDVRPYGPKGEWVCFACGMKDEAAAQRAFSKRLAEGDYDTSERGSDESGEEKP